MRHAFQGDFIRHSTASRLEEAMSFAKHATIWLLVSFSITGLVWVTNTYGGLSAPDEPVSQMLSSTQAAE
jgi:hypothetical protein